MAGLLTGGSTNSANSESVASGYCSRRSAVCRSFSGSWSNFPRSRRLRMAASCCWAASTALLRLAVSQLTRRLTPLAHFFLHFGLNDFHRTQRRTDHGDKVHNAVTLFIIQDAAAAAPGILWLQPQLIEQAVGLVADLDMPCHQLQMIPLVRVRDTASRQKRAPHKALRQQFSSSTPRLICRAMAS